tara:strand:+ start:757 stop:1455 length:699 start_codon:yes stop_codon:yes gene_type:complete
MVVSIGSNRIKVYQDNIGQFIVKAIAYYWIFNYITSFNYLHASRIITFLLITIKLQKRNNNILLIIPPLNVKDINSLKEILDEKSNIILEKYNKIIFYNLKEMIPFKNNDFNLNFEYPIQYLDIENSYDIYLYTIAKHLKIYLLNYPNYNISICGIKEGSNISFILSHLLNYKVKNLHLLYSYIPLNKKLYKNISNKMDNIKIKLCSSFFPTTLEDDFISLFTKKKNFSNQN